MKLNTVSQTATKITVGWTPPAGCVGYEYFRDNVRVSGTFDGTRNQVTFGIPDSNPHTYEVRALGSLDSGTATVNTPTPPPPPPPPPSSHGARSLPQGPFTDKTSAAWYRTTAGGTISKVHVHDTPDYGVAVMGYFSPAPPAPSTGVWTVTDVIGERVGHTPPSSNGTAEAGLWFGQQVNVTRALGNGTWMGAWTGAQCRDSTITDLTCAVLNADGTLGKLPGIGLYLEHSTRRLVIDGLTIRSHNNGINCEWTYKDSYAQWLIKEYPNFPAGRSGSLDVEIRNFDIDSDAWGIFLDAGTCGFHIHDGVIRGNNGITHPKNLAIASKPNVIDWSTIDFRGTGTKELVHGNAIG